MNYVYVIKSQATGKIYIGQTDNVIDRLARHNKKLPLKRKGYTYKNIGPWELIYKEEFLNREDAFSREKQLKSFRGREYIKNVLGL